MKMLTVLIFMTFGHSAYAQKAITPFEKPLKLRENHSRCQAKNNAPVEVSSSRNGANVTVTIKVLHDLPDAKINVSAVDDLEFITDPEDIEKDLTNGETLTIDLKIKPTPHLSYVAVQVEGLLHNFPRVKSVTVPVQGTSKFGHLPKELFEEKQREKISGPKKVRTRKGRPVKIMKQ